MEKLLKATGRRTMAVVESCSYSGSLLSGAFYG